MPQRHHVAERISGIRGAEEHLAARTDREALAIPRGKGHMQTAARPVCYAKRPTAPPPTPGSAHRQRRAGPCRREPAVTKCLTGRTHRRREHRKPWRYQHHLPSRHDGRVPARRPALHNGNDVPFQKQNGHPCPCIAPVQTPHRTAPTAPPRRLQSISALAAQLSSARRVAVFVPSRNAE